MTTVLVTGAAGFIGKHLVEALGRRREVQVIGFDLDSPESELERGLREADIVFHLAGVNRPREVTEFQAGNADFTAELCSKLQARRSLPSSSSPTPPAADSQPVSMSACEPLSAPTLSSDSALPAPRSALPLLVLSSSIQAALDNPYGVSKRQAEESVASWARMTGASAVVFRLKNVFGKWCRPNYNSVTATFCHNIAHGLPITISDPSRQLELVYIDDVIAAFLAVFDAAFPTPTSSNPLAAPSSATGPSILHSPSSIPASGPALPASGSCLFLDVPRSFTVTLGDLAARLQSFQDSRKTLLLPSFADDFTRCLYATYLSYLDGQDFAYSLDKKTDNRGELAEFMKSPHFGQIFVSRTRPGITRGNHYHHTKTEKFLVLEGDAIIRFRPIQPEVGPSSASAHSIPHSAPPTPSSESVSPLIEHRVSGRDFRVVDIPPGYTHSIENIGSADLIVLFWASAIFDPATPDTFALPVLSEAASAKP